MTRKKPRISMISAITKNRAIGKNNKLLFKIPDDLKRFKEITWGHPVIMGMNTYFSLGRPLPGRLNIVITNDPQFKAEGVKIVYSLEEALKTAIDADSEEVFFIGGGMVYKSALPFTDRLYLTIIDKEVEGDTYFPDFSEFKKVIFQEQRSFGDLKYKFVVLER